MLAEKTTDWLIRLDRVNTSLLLLATLAGLGLLAGILYRIGLIGLVLRLVGLLVRDSIRRGFRLWERLLSWAGWGAFLAIVASFIVAGWLGGGLVPGLRVVCGTIPLFMGAITCLAYMYIDLERYEVERGHMAIHNPLKGQDLAVHLARYGHRVRVPLLIAATLALICGFAMLNQGLYETIGRGWFEVVGGRGEPIYVDFVAYALTKILGLIDVLNLADSRHWIRAAYIRQAAWPASVLLTGFKVFFSVVMLQQLFASLRQGKLLAETIADFWSPHEPIRDRARGALAQYGATAIGPLLVSLRSVPSLTKEQRDQLPSILATIGPSTIPSLLRHVNDSHEHVRAIAAASLGLLHAIDSVPMLVGLARDPSELVRQSAVESLGRLGEAAAGPSRNVMKAVRGRGSAAKRFRWPFRWRRRGAESIGDPVALCVETLRTGLEDESAAVRTQAARAVGRIGSPAAEVAPGLITLLDDADETVRCDAAAALGRVGGDTNSTLSALIGLLGDSSSPVKAAAARAIGSLKAAAAPAVPALVPLLQERDEAVRTAAAEAIAQVGPLDELATESLVKGLDSPDTVVRAQTAEALGTIGSAAEDAAPALVEAMTDSNDRVRAKAVEAIGKLGESAGEAAIPGLVRALRDQDNWVSALAAEALGQMGESADGAIPALVRSLGHVNPQVRMNAAEALGNLGEGAVGVRTALERSASDEDGGVRGQAIRALGAIGGAEPGSLRVVLEGLKDLDPIVRAASVSTLGRWGWSDPEILAALTAMFDDPNDGVKVEVIRVLPKLAGPAEPVIDGLCRRLAEDDSAWVQIQAALALGQLGPEASAAGGALLRALKTGEVSVREQAMRAIAMIRPPETSEALAVGLTDASGEIRMVASATWMKAESIHEDAVPLLVEALHDPEIQVRSNAAHALARLESLPTDAIPLLLDCIDSANDGLRLNAAMALKRAPVDEAVGAMQPLLEDSNSRVRLIAAGVVLNAGEDDGRASAVLKDSLGDLSPRVRKAAIDLVETLESRGVEFLASLKDRAQVEEDDSVRNDALGLVERLEAIETSLPDQDQDVAES
jgi:HEAT repeat protein